MVSADLPTPPPPTTTSLYSVLRAKQRSNKHFSHNKRETRPNPRNRTINQNKRSIHANHTQQLTSPDLFQMKSYLSKRFFASESAGAKIIAPLREFSNRSFET
jgi:hypothetical protein